MLPFPGALAVTSLSTPMDYLPAFVVAVVIVSLASALAIVSIGRRDADQPQRGLRGRLAPRRAR